MVLLVSTVRGKVLYHNSPDGGWAWVVLVAGFVNMAIVFSIARSLGMFYNDFMDHFGTTNSQTSWIWALAISMFGLAAPVGGILIRMFDSRRILLLSGLLCCVGMVIPVFATEIWMVYVGIGFIWGLGFSWTYMSLVTQINVYFSRWRALANGVLAGGSAFGAAVMPIAIEKTREIYGWRGTMLILAGVGLNICAFGALMRPISVISAKKMHKYRDLPYVDKATDTDEIRGMTVSLEVLDYMDKADDNEVTKNESPGGRLCKFINDYWLLAWYGLTQFAVGVCLFIPVMYLVPFAKAADCTGEEAALLLSMTAFGDILFRPLSGLIMSCMPTLERNVLFCLTFITLAQGGLCLIPIYGSGFKTLAIYSAIYGCIYGCFVPSNTTTFPILLGKENLTKYMGNFFFMSGIATLVSPPIAGYLVDVFDTYRAVYWYAMIGFLFISFQFMITGLCVRSYGAMLPQHRKT